MTKTLLISSRGQPDQAPCSHCSPLEQALPEQGHGRWQAARGQGRYSWESACLPCSDKRRSDRLTQGQPAHNWGRPRGEGHIWGRRGHAGLETPDKSTLTLVQPPTHSGPRRARPISLFHLPSTPQGSGWQSMVWRSCKATCSEGNPHPKVAVSISISDFVGPNRRPIVGKGPSREGQHVSEGVSAQE